MGRAGANLAPTSRCDMDSFLYRDQEVRGAVPRHRDPQRGERGHLLQDPAAAGQAGQGDPGVHPEAQVLPALPAARPAGQGQAASRSLPQSEGRWRCALPSLLLTASPCSCR